MRDTTSQLESSNSVKFQATTFSNPTANFVGISDVRNLSGSNGLNGIEVVWPEAQVLGSDVFKNTIDPVEYKVTVIDSTYLTPGSMNDTSFGEPVRKVISASGNQRNLVINGLKPGIKYFIQVRCVHYAYAANSADANYKLEENTNYMAISTYTDDLSSLHFENNSFFLSWPPGAGGLNALIGNWTAPTGNFDHFRIYYAQNADVSYSSLNAYLNNQDGDALCDEAEIANSKIFCQQADSNLTSVQITGLQPNATYNAILAVCLTSDCKKSKRVISFTQTKTTTPNFANFGGITTINTSNDIINLNTLQLNFIAPDFTSGNISGFLVDYYGNDPKSLTPSTLNDPSIANPTSLTVDSFNYLTDTSITIRGVDYSSLDQQCYLVYPFTYILGGSKQVSKTGLTPVCITPILTKPTSLEFPGFNNTDTACNSYTSKLQKQAYLSWISPTKGIYDQYEIFYIKSSTFNFVDAISGIGDPSTNYNRIVIDGSKTDYTLTNMETGNPGDVYKIGILSYYNSPLGPIRSEFNASVITCDFH
jgi:hypothetical protein